MRLTSRAVHVKRHPSRGLLAALSILVTVGLGAALGGCTPDLGQAPFLCNAGNPKCPSGYICNESNLCVRDGACTPGDPGCGGCGDGVCDEAGGEDVTSCPEDCPVVEPDAGDSCGNGTCDDGEDATSCPQDCQQTPPVGTCGDGTCQSTETPTSCPQDCPSTPPPSSCTAGEVRCAGTTALERCDGNSWVKTLCTDFCARDGLQTDGCRYSSAEGQDACSCVGGSTTKLPYGSFCAGDTECATGMCMQMSGVISSGAYCTASCSKDSDCPDLGGSTASVCDLWSNECMLDCYVGSCPSGMSCSEFLYDYKCVPWL